MAAKIKKCDIACISGTTIVRTVNSKHYAGRATLCLVATVNKSWYT